MKLTLFMVFYRALWVLLLPFVLLYLWRRGRRDPDYTGHLAERFGVYSAPLPQNAIWFHAVSIGETRSAIALIRLVLDRGDKVVLTHFTPAGRRDSTRQFAAEIASGQLAVVWAPFDMLWCYRRFFRACRPQIGLPLEVEVWPAMIYAARTAGVPLYMCNAQYAPGPFERDRKWLPFRRWCIRAFAGAFVKSQGQAERFALVGLKNVTVTGELRFDQPVPPALTEAARKLRPVIAAERDVLVIASGVEGEEDLYSAVLSQLVAACRKAGEAAPFIIYVPRAPERFDAVAEKLQVAGLSVCRRSAVLDADLAPVSTFDSHDVLLGDSLGEMFFYLALADRVIVGGGFTPRGAHNIIEPLLLRKPVLTGPWVWPIEFPFTEAKAAGVAVSVPDQDALLAALGEPLRDQSVQINTFLAQHIGASARTLDEIDAVIGRT
ncbi:MAG: 3-deoxy-D-manno-octulosonic acid transferase [Yoonia sp.]